MRAVCGGRDARPPAGSAWEALPVRRTRPHRRGAGPNTTAFKSTPLGPLGISKPGGFRENPFTPSPFSATPAPLSLSSSTSCKQTSVGSPTRRLATLASCPVSFRRLPGLDLGTRSSGKSIDIIKPKRLYREGVANDGHHLSTLCKAADQTQLDCA